VKKINFEYLEKNFKEATNDPKDMMRVAEEGICDCDDDEDCKCGSWIHTSVAEASVLDRLCPAKPIENLEDLKKIESGEIIMLVDINDKKEGDKG